MKEKCTHPFHSGIKNILVNSAQVGGLNIYLLKIYRCSPQIIWRRNVARFETMFCGLKKLKLRLNYSSMIHPFNLFYFLFFTHSSLSLEIVVLFIILIVACLFVFFFFFSIFQITNQIYEGQTKTKLTQT